LKSSGNLRGVWIIYVLIFLIILGGLVIYWKYPKTLTIGFLERLPLNINTLGVRSAVINALEEMRKNYPNVKYRLMVKDYTNYVELKDIYNTLAKNKYVQAIIGPLFSSDAKEIVDLVNEYNKLTFLQGITNPNVLKSSKYFVSTGISDEIQVKTIEAYIDYKNYRNITIIKSKSNPVYTDYIASKLSKDFATTDRKIRVFTFDANKKEQEFHGKISDETELIILITPIEESAAIIKNLNFKGEFLLTDWSASRELINLLGSKSEGILMISFCPYVVLEKSPYENYFYVAAFETVGLLNELFLKKRLKKPFEVFLDYTYKGKYMKLHFKGGLLKNDVYIWKVENLSIKDYMKFLIESGRLQEIERQIGK